VDPHWKIAVAYSSVWNRPGTMFGSNNRQAATSSSRPTNSRKE
jgi:hypothetical protein